MKRLICLAAAIVLTAGSVQAMDISAESAILLDACTGSVLYEKNADQRRPIASTTKIMTGLISAEIYEPDQSVVIKPEWCGVEGSSMYLTAGETLAVSDLMHGLMLMSGNDAAKALSCIYTGNSSDFIDLMNQKSQDLGLENSHFANPSGLDDKSHYSTARDMAKLTRTALANELFASVCATKQIEAAGRFMTNHNKLLFSLAGAIGVKTGFTDEAGRCLVSAVSREGRTLIAVTLDASDDWNDHEKLYDMGFYDMRTRQIIKKGLVGYAYIAGKGMTPLHINADINAYITGSECERLDVTLKGPRMTYGSVQKDTKYGEIIIKLDGAVLCTEPVFFSENIEAECAVPTLWERIKGIFTRR